MSERTVYAIASGKGGVGKTTTAINLGATLADGGDSVVVVDTDLGMANLADFLDFEIESPTLHEVLAGEAAFEDAVYRAPGGIDVLPSATDIEAFTKSDPANLGPVVEDLRKEYDYVLLDTGAGVSYDTLVPLALADAVLLVATPDVASVRDTAKTGELAERVDTEVAGAVLAQRSSDILNADDVEETLGTDVLAVVPEDEAVPMGIDAGRPLAAFAPNAPAGRAYRDLADVVTGETDPDPELDAVTDDSARPTEREATSSGSSGPSEATEIDAGGADIREAEVREAEGSGSTETEGSGIREAERSEVREVEATGGRAAEATGGRAAGGASGDASDTTDAADTADTADDLLGDASDDPLSADAARSVRDAIEDESGDAIEDGPGDDIDDLLGSQQAADGDSASEARSVDDLIDEHISDDRLDGENSFGDAADDPLAEDDGPDPVPDESDDLFGDDEADAERSLSEGDPETGTADAESDAPEADEDGPRPATLDDGGPDEPPADGDAAFPASDADESPASDCDADDPFGDDGADDEESDAGGGVLGRIGSLFR